MSVCLVAWQLILVVSLHYLHEVVIVSLVIQAVCPTVVLICDGLLASLG